MEQRSFQKPVFAEVDKKFSAFYDNRGSIIVFTRDLILIQINLGHNLENFLKIYFNIVTCPLKARTVE
jgi:hypothetical protein